MIVALINPPHLYLKQPDSQIPIGILYLASILREAGHTVIFKDYSCSNPGNIQIPKAQLYGITGTCVDIEGINSVINSIRNENNIPIILGGPCTLDPIGIMPVNSYVIGEAETVILDIIKDVENRKLQTIYKGMPVENLDSLPTPARDLLPSIGGNIFLKNKKYAKGESTTILTSRGCPHKCAFCASPGLYPKLRMRSPENVASEVKEVIDRYNVYNIKFSDDSLTSNRKRLYKICELIKDFNIYWRASIRTSPNDLKLFKAMKNSGCVEVSFGVESFDQFILDVLNKKAKVESSIIAIKNAKQAGLTVRALMMSSLPLQRKETMVLNKKYIKQIKEYIDGVACKTFVPMPGCDIYNNPSKYKIRILSKDYRDYNFHLFGTEGRRSIPRLIEFLHRDGKEIHKESEDFHNFLIDEGLANEG